MLNWRSGWHEFRYFHEQNPKKIRVVGLDLVDIEDSNSKLHVFRVTFCRELYFDAKCDEEMVVTWKYHAGRLVSKVILFILDTKIHFVLSPKSRLCIEGKTGKSWCFLKKIQAEATPLWITLSPKSKERICCSGKLDWRFRLCSTRRHRRFHFDYFDKK